MAIGEKVKVAGDRTATLTEARKRTNDLEKVYNFEVWREHNYFVGKEGVLVHNNYAFELFKNFAITNLDNILIPGKKWTHKARKTDKLDTEGDIEEIRMSEIIGEKNSSKVYLAPKDNPGFDAITENGRVLSYKGLRGVDAQSNIDALRDNLNKAFDRYKNKAHNKLPDELKNEVNCEVWVSGKHASGQQMLLEWENLKSQMLESLSNNYTMISKIFYIGPDNQIYQLF